MPRIVANYYSIGYSRTFYYAKLTCSTEVKDTEQQSITTLIRATTVQPAQTTTTCNHLKFLSIKSLNE